MEFKSIETSGEVWSEMWARHSKELELYSSYTSHNNDRGYAETEYSFKGSDFPIIKVRAEWVGVPEPKGIWDPAVIRAEWDCVTHTSNYKTMYFICLPKNEVSDD